jgi:hypothetical protein
MSEARDRRTGTKRQQFPLGGPSPLTVAGAAQHHTHSMVFAFGSVS